jgi:hypothetical protein
MIDGWWLCRIPRFGKVLLDLAIIQRASTIEPMFAFCFLLQPPKIDPASVS